MTIEEKCRQLIAWHLDVDEDRLKPESNLLDDLGADSLDIVELVLEAEEQFEIDIPDKDMEGLRTVAECVAYVERRKAAPTVPNGYRS